MPLWCPVVNNPKLLICPGSTLYTLELILYSSTHSLNELTMNYFLLQPRRLSLFWILSLICVRFNAQCGLTISFNVPSGVVAGENVTINSTVSGGATPYQFSWSPSGFFVSPSNGSQQNQVVNLPVSTTFELTVTTASQCIQKRTIDVVVEPFAKLESQPTGGYYRCVNNKLPFAFEGQYSQTNLRYKVLNGSNQEVASNTLNNIASSLVVQPGDNRYYLNVASLPTGFYLLEISNEKNEKLYLRFTK